MDIGESKRWEAKLKEKGADECAVCQNPVVVLAESSVAMDATAMVTILTGCESCGHMAHHAVAFLES